MERSITAAEMLCNNSVDGPLTALSSVVHENIYRMVS